MEALGVGLRFAGLSEIEIGRVDGCLPEVTGVVQERRAELILQKEGFVGAVFQCDWVLLKAALKSIRPVTGFLWHLAIHVCFVAALFSPNSH